MLDGFRMLGVILGIFMGLSSLAPSSEPPLILDIIFLSFFSLTGIVMAIPYKLVKKFVTGSFLSWFLLVVAVPTLFIHCCILYQAGSEFGHFVIVFLAIYPLIFVNIVWYSHAVRL